ncbi:MAG: hypothetical protein J0H57_03270, partial [Rhodospirillales bacterium]|nr:hypothetical protein [Rhodospirillales bacterium]
MLAMQRGGDDGCRLHRGPAAPDQRRDDPGTGHQRGRDEQPCRDETKDQHHADDRHLRDERSRAVARPEPTSAGAHLRQISHRDTAAQP